MDDLRKGTKALLSFGLPMETMRRLREYASREDRSVASASRRLILVGLDAEDKRLYANNSSSSWSDTAAQASGLRTPEASKAQWEARKAAMSEEERAQMREMNDMSGVNDKEDEGLARLQAEYEARVEKDRLSMEADGDEGEDDGSEDVEDEDDYDDGEDAAAEELEERKREYNADQAKLAEGRYKDAVPEGSRSPIKFG